MFAQDQLTMTIEFASIKIWILKILNLYITSISTDIVSETRHVLQRSSIGSGTI